MTGDLDDVLADPARLLSGDRSALRTLLTQHTPAAQVRAETTDRILHPSCPDPQTRGRSYYGKDVPRPNVTDPFWSSREHTGRDDHDRLTVTPGDGAFGGKGRT